MVENGSAARFGCGVIHIGPELWMIHIWETRCAYADLEVVTCIYPQAVGKSAFERDPPRAPTRNVVPRETMSSHVDERQLMTVDHESAAAVPTPQPVDVEPRPAVADEVFGTRVALAQQYADALVSDGELLGLLGPQEYPRLWTRHIINSALIAPLLDGHVADVGSGAGLPGIPLAIARPDVQFTLIEPMERRSKWLLEQVDALDLENVTVTRARAEEIADSHSFDQVTARAVAALSKLIPWTAPLLRYGGELVLLKGQSAEAEIQKAAKMIRRYHLEDVRVEEVGTDLDTESTRVVRAVIG